jgi:hypothetical protein
MILKQTGTDLLLSIDSALLAMPFYTIGFYTKKINIDVLSKKVVSILLFVLFGIITLLLALYNGAVDINNLLFGRNIGIFYLTGVIGSIAIMSLSFILNQISFKIVSIISSGTLVIMAFHGIINGYFVSIFTRVYKENLVDVPLIYGIIIAICTLLVCMFLRVITIYYDPFLFGNKKDFVTDFAHLEAK